STTHFRGPARNANRKPRDIMWPPRPSSPMVNLAIPPITPDSGRPSLTSPVWSPLPTRSPLDRWSSPRTVLGEDRERYSSGPHLTSPFHVERRGTSPKPSVFGARRHRGSWDVRATPGRV